MFDTLTEHYQKLYQQALHNMKMDNCETDNLIDSPFDNRFGITLLLRPNNHVKQNIQVFLNELKAITPPQYFYPNSDIHVTILSIISCYNGFDLSQININEYVDIIKKSLLNGLPFSIHFKGITASPSCIMIQGFPIDDTINDIRENLRKYFKNTSLQQSIDIRYSIQTVHSTVVRFREKLEDKEQFFDILDKYRDFDFGITPVSKVELVYNDWYQRKRFVKKLYTFDLKS